MATIEDSDKPRQKTVQPGQTDAADRTDWAEDRTIMANERTYAGWLRTGLATVGVGIAFHALFAKLQPPWLPKLLATTFVGVGILVFILARYKAVSVMRRLSAHYAKPIPMAQVTLVAICLVIASLGLVLGLWLV